MQDYPAGVALLLAVALVVAGTLFWFLPVVGWPFALGAYALAVVVAIAGRGSGVSLLNLSRTGRERSSGSALLIVGGLLLVLVVVAMLNGPGR